MFSSSLSLICFREGVENDQESDVNLSQLNQAVCEVRRFLNPGMKDLSLLHQDPNMMNKVEIAASILKYDSKYRNIDLCERNPLLCS